MSILRAKKKKKRPVLKFIVVLIIVWAASGLYLSYKATKNLENLKNPEKQVKILRLIKFFPSYTEEVNNVWQILNGKKVEPFDKKLYSSSYKTILAKLIENNLIDRFKSLMEYINSKKEKPELPYFNALYLFNNGEFEQAKPYLEKDKKFANMYKSGEVPVIENLLYYNMKTKKYRCVYRGMKFLEKHFPAKRDFLKIYKSSINKRMQEYAETMLGKQEGFFAVQKAGFIYCMVANGVDPFTDYFEPGSVIKLITLTGYLEENRNDVKFPFYCIKPLNIDGKAFYDWKKHGKIPSVEEALAESCNLVFAECALSLGKTDLMDWYSKFYIDKNKKVKVCEFEFNPAYVKKEILDKYTLAEAGIGIEVPYVTPYWLLKTSAIIARYGKDTTPTCALFEDSTFNENTVFEYNDKIKPLYNGMLKAVELPIGTGKRAKVDNIKIYLKTGTAGKKPFNAFIVGFANYKRLDYSFALFLKNGGKAEFKAAKTINEFFSSFDKFF
ncbi:hypothetical protein TTHT_1092 [Thermotomaculum hydrothermale]|uniref:Penicillin-binding protein transpeptidase domain-containing protein n=1 Tax=Thermotomaculum hydrothermale TaxID=981385 RepID=A0A7R6PF81_9BACT|nr:penicillin-binding transpeptidase domain-containing protein [Thermotomaculum hydrothermale]BBB32629.1 hypothetical protein TTHT_1092 [Thermotomaculum hydrothermale]